MNPPLPACNTPRELRALGQPLPNLADALGKQQTINIVAIGSSSTEGDGASPEGSYPKRLEVALGPRFPGKTIKVFNKGKGGEEAPDEAARFKTDVFPNNPSLVIWQVGTNAAWKNYVLADVRTAILEGLDQLKGYPADVVLMNLQYAPALIDQERPKPATQEMLDIIARVAETSNIGLFRRFEIMRYWRQQGGVPFDQMISNFDGNCLHQNDWSYNCIAEALSDAIADGMD